MIPVHFFLTNSFRRPSFTSAGDKMKSPENSNVRPLWRGPSRDGQWTGAGVAGWAVQGLAQLDVEYSALTKLLEYRCVRGFGFNAETANKGSEVVAALDRKTGSESWRAERRGAMTVSNFNRNARRSHGQEDH